MTTGAIMSNPTSKGQVHNPQDLARLSVAKMNAGDLEGITALYEPEALLNRGDGRLIHGR